ncbi:MAG TPA: EipA family protein [Allosphingosinicella sp.]
MIMPAKMFFRMLAIAGLAAAVPAGAQITQIDPNQAGQYQAPATGGTETAPPASEPAPYSNDFEYQPIDPGYQGSQAATQPQAATQQGATGPRDDVFSAAESVFGKGAEGLGSLLEKILKDQGEPTAYIRGQEAGGAFVVGVRYGSGTLHHQIEGDRPIYWTGPSVGFDFGADANKIFVLIYNLHDTQELYRRFPGAEGNAYVVGGFTASYIRRGDIVLIPVRLGVGLRLGVNAGYMSFSEKNKWLPF